MAAKAADAIEAADVDQQGVGNSGAVNPPAKIAAVRARYPMTAEAPAVDVDVDVGVEVGQAGAAYAGDLAKTCSSRLVAYGRQRAARPRISNRMMVAAKIAAGQSLAWGDPYR